MYKIIYMYAYLFGEKISEYDNKYRANQVKNINAM